MTEQGQTPSVAEAVQLYASIKRTSKYYYQGLDQAKTPRLFRIKRIKQDSHAFRMNSNNYRQQDLDFFVVDPTGRFIQL